MRDFSWLNIVKGMSMSVRLALVNKARECMAYSTHMTSEAEPNQDDRYISIQNDEACEPDKKSA